MTPKALSREIKFRVWQNEWKKMYKVRSIHFNDKGDIIGLHYKLTSGRIGAAVCIDTYLEIDSVVLMQYTGLKDMHGKEIYEGDILTTKYGNVEVVYYKSSFTLKREGSSLIELNGLSNLVDCSPIANCTHNNEIIGNIYENPELLTKENKSL